MAKSDPLLRAGHRERLRQKFEEGKLSDDEELELLLTYVIQRRDVRVISRLLRARFGTAYNAMLADSSDITSINGVGPGVALFFKLLRSIVAKGYKRHLVERHVFAHFNVLENYCRTQLAHKKIEELHVFYLDHEYRLICDDLHNIGSVNSSYVYADKILADALTKGASMVILCHNHPVGGVLPSMDDISLTTYVGKMLLDHHIKLHDHIIVSSDGSVYSMRNARQLGELEQYEFKKVR